MIQKYNIVIPKLNTKYNFCLKYNFDLIKSLETFILVPCTYHKNITIYTICVYVCIYIYHLIIKEKNWVIFKTKFASVWILYICKTIRICYIFQGKKFIKYSILILTAWYLIKFIVAKEKIWNVTKLIYKRKNINFYKNHMFQRIFIKL